MNDRELAEQILQYIGGESNINDVQHCTTRLRFKVQEEAIVEKQALQQLPDILQVIEAAGQLQLVIGPEVSDISKQIKRITHITDGKKDKKSNISFLNYIIDVISGIFMPLVGSLAAVGILKGLLLVAVNLDVISDTSGLYQILYAASDSLFYFLPLILAITAARKFHADPYIAFIIAASLLYPNLVTAYETGNAYTFLGVPVILTNYSSTVLPIVIAVYVMAQLQHKLNDWIPKSIKMFFIPLILITVMVPATLLIFGPLGSLIGDIIAIGYDWVNQNSAVLAGAIIGFFWQVLVVSGLHWVISPIVVNNINQFGSDTLVAMIVPSILSQAGATFGVVLRTNHKQTKTIASTATIASIMGVTEPAIYGINLPNKRAFIFGCFAGAVGGALAGLSGASTISLVIPGITALPALFGEGFVLFVIATFLSFCLATVLTYFFGAKSETAFVHNQSEPVVKSMNVIAPMEGAVLSLVDVPDDVFASGVIGEGVALVPVKDELYAPYTGSVNMIFPTGHAIGFISEHGVELLIHIGLNTVRLEETYVEYFVQEGEKVQAGQLIGRVDRSLLAANGFDLITPVVVTNHDQFMQTIQVDKENIKKGEELITVIF
ncbi:PTS system beta-glucoside-specific EIIBCA component [Paraliobacillus ryukyuensis]|uniref:PTS system beta-glucosides-specific IIC component n=1 Tax=Paraliobacillus ryukyuensis TaxID=200904 RepID=A0A366DWV0_9BACI|nr:beta-glucoside-specific PTS transporter subunit IIABC [Paraliobacillus ryukyuensis]RBO94591.1 PTS system beta-glucosides-specific IIC component [Paraliobacillus ryukyuensis]